MSDTAALLPPHDLNAEASVLSATMLDATALPKLVDFLRHEHFFSEAHRRIFEACLGLLRERQPIDITTVSGWLHARGRLGQVGGTVYIMEILDACPVVANVRAHAIVVHDHWRRRQMIQLCQRIAAQGYTSVGDVQGWSEDATRAVARIADDNPVRAVESNEEAIQRLLAEAFGTRGDAAEMGSIVTGFPTGLHGLDRILGGLHKGAKTTIAATTGAGKTALAGQFAVRLAKRGIGVGMFSTEVKREGILLRAVSAESGVPLERIKQRRLSPADREKMVAAAKTIKALPWFIDETARITIDEIASATKALQERMRIVDRVPLGVVIIDYIQRLDPPKHQAHRESNHQIAYATKRFKMLCQELDIAGIELAQAKPLERGKRPEKPHASNCIADSSVISKEADNIIVLVAETEATEFDPRTEVTAHVVKQRDGRKGPVPLLFRGDIYTFIDPNEPGAASNPSRQYVDPMPERTPEPPAGFFDDFTEGT